jgi:DNA modification methylase
MTGARILIGDCRQRLKELPDNSVDSVVTDPPYHLTSGKKGGSGEASVNLNSPAGRARISTGFMGQEWDGGDVAFDPETWAEVLRVLKPGGHLVAFSGTRTYHRMAVAIEDAGFEIRDQLGWLYGSGFPKSHDVSKGIDKLAGAEREVVGPRMRPDGKSQLSARGGDEGRGEGWDRPWRNDPEAVARNGMETAPATDAAREWQGWGTALKPAWEAICLARKRLEGTVASNVLKHGTGAINIDGCRIEARDAPEQAEVSANAQSRYVGVLNGGKVSEAEPRTTSASQQGRWPANIIHDGSEEVLAGFPIVDGPGGYCDPAKTNGGMFGENRKRGNGQYPGEQGSAARFFYCAKAAGDERGSKCLICGQVAARPADECSCSQCLRCEATGPCPCIDHETKLPTRKPQRLSHPTVKPHPLMAWLVRLVTPKGGTVLDPFLGSGSTAVAAQAEQFGFVGCELSADYAAIAEARLRRGGGLFASVTMSPLPPAESTAP